jgi:hypothetical protein
VQLIQHEFRQCPAVSLVGPLLLEGQQVLLEQLIKRCLFRLPPRIGVPARGLYACRSLHDGGLSASDGPLLLRLPVFLGYFQNPDTPKISGLDPDGSPGVAGSAPT